MKLFNTQLSYPGRNFGGNQLLDGSISLSPLYPIPEIDLHVRILTDFHRSFLRLHLDQVKFTIFRVPASKLLLKSSDNVLGSDRSAAPLDERFLPFFTFIARNGFLHHNVCLYARLLSPCYKTGRKRLSKILMTIKFPR